MPWITESGSLDRATLRQQLLEARERFVASPSGPAAHRALGQRLKDVLEALEPQVLGLYWPVRSEFNARVAWGDDMTVLADGLALPFARRHPPTMAYRRWDGRDDPPVRDECGIPSTEGAVVVPDVVLVPCVGYTREGYRLGYGGGYFDRWLAAHPGVTPVGVAWHGSQVALQPEPHDQPLTLVVTEDEVIAP
ncbi:5-formyltetrahydrofolate cyclo-ligase [Caldimonas caldifontis]|uniref:5-formyltetrahydrofolate cyclo-ligase n=1 Tax=Caldimonas caldifontis TaxID=1452508 RepID=A0A2S5SVD7_9BURK|nr:5-formyltetrahydrofolate cyclo-ligase [Caldimonas caldifontis]PPE66638.1 5-formyltetrahydrofolate cyclo-ligase [Caldimonas caldifontis]